MVKILFSFLFSYFIISNLFGQSILINEYCSQNKYFLDEDGESSDWFELVNSGTETINLLNYSISDDSTDLEKWLFPEINLSPNELLLVFASGKDRSEISFYQNLINEGDTFSYAVGSAEIPMNWKIPDFDVSSWDIGPSGFGYGDNDDVTEFNPGTLSIFVRKEFQISNIDNIAQLLLHMDYDDGFVAYVNGIEIARANLGIPNTEVPYNQTADNAIEPIISGGGTPELFILENVKDVLVEGSNVLAIQVHNASTSSSDITLIPFLSVASTSPENVEPLPEILKLNNTALHTNFKISADGERLFLSDSQGLLLDKTDSIPLPIGISYGRLADDLTKWVYFAEPTPASPNSTQGFDSLVNSSISFSPSGGRYNSSTKLSLSTNSNAKIFYTTDGTDPTINSTLYTLPLTLNKTTVIKAIALDPNVLSISTSVESYIIENREITLPVVSLVTDPYNLFDWDYGIYATGPNAESNNPYFGANFWQDWERPINIEYFDKAGNKVFSSGGGVKIYGAWSRANGLSSNTDDPKNSQKSLAIAARSEYGNKSFKYPFFTERDNDKYKALVLRNSGNDWGSTAMRDAMMTGLLRNVDIDRQAYQPTALFINGDYWGIQNLREKVNEDFLADNHVGVEANQVDILMNNGEVLEGSAEHYTHMISYIKTHPMSDDANYDSVCKLMDVVNFMDYEIAEIYYDNQDWPGNNIKFWRPQTATGKWRWIIYDTDFGFGMYGGQNYKFNTLEFALQPNGSDWPNPPWSTFLLRSLIENKTFKREFINRFADRINQEFKPSTVNYFIDSLKKNIVEEIPYHIERWNHIWDFDGNVNVLKAFSNLRPSYMRSHIVSEFDLGGTANLVIDISDDNAGKVQVNSLMLEQYPWSGKYFKDNLVPIIAVANPGYEFSHWEGIDSDKEYLIFDFKDATVSLKAVFKLSEMDYNSIVINEINYISSDDADCGDWIELYNTTNANINISGWELKDGDDANSFIVPEGTVITGKKYMVLSRSLTKFGKVYPQVGNVIGDFGFGLGSTYDIIKLYDRTKLLIDSVTYFNEYPWPYIDPNQTISLTTPYSDNSIGANWQASTGNGTPGSDNDYFTKIKEKPQHTNGIMASCYPNPATNQSVIRWSCDAPQHVQINIYNVRGELLSQVFNNNCPVGTFEEQLFDRSIYNGGIYFVQVKYANGNAKTMKLVKL